MFGSSALDVAIGLLFIFAVFSLLTSGIQEGIATILSRRSRNLWDNLQELFGEATIGEKVLIDTFYRSPFVTQLVTPKRRRQMAATQLSSAARFLRGGNVSVNGAIRPEELKAAADVNGRKLARLYGPTSIAPASFSRALLDVLKPGGELDDTIVDLKEIINNIDDSTGEFKRTLVRLAEESGSDVARFRRSLEQWFENQMDHVTEWYRRNTRIWLFAIGLVLAGAFNVDTIGAGVELWEDDELRAALVAEASTTQDFKDCQAIDSAVDRTSCITTAIGETDELPIGYDNGWDADLPSSLLRIVGWLITAAAMMAGGAFWFDLLRRAISLKGRINSANSPTGA